MDDDKTDNVLIRDLGPGDDVERLVAIALAAWPPLHEYLRERMGEELYRAAHPDWRKDKAEQIRAACRPGSGAGVCVAEIAGRIVGFATYYTGVRPGMGEIGNNAVEPDCQGRGVGTRMYEYVFARLKQRGMEFVKVGTGVDPAHAPARRAYEKAGFATGIPKGIEYYRKL